MLGYGHRANDIVYAQRRPQEPIIRKHPFLCFLSIAIHTPSSSSSSGGVFGCHFVPLGLHRSEDAGLLVSL
jgi:hypothetical protein